MCNRKKKEEKKKKTPNPTLLSQMGKIEKKNRVYEGDKQTTKLERRGEILPKQVSHSNLCLLQCRFQFNKSRVGSGITIFLQDSEVCCWPTNHVCA